MNKVKILHLQVLPILSGVQNMMINLLSGLPPEKYEIYVISRGGGELEQAVIQRGWTHIAVKSLCREISYKDIISAIKIHKIIKKIRPNIVHTHSAKTGFIGRIVARMLRVPLVIHTVHGFPFHDYQNTITKYTYLLFESFAAMFAHYNVFVQNYEKDIAINKYHYKPQKTLTIRNGIDIYDSQKTLFYHDDTLKIASVLRFSKQKNILQTIKQAINIVKKYQNVTFTFYGDGELFESCEKLIKEQDVADKIICPGWQTDIREKLLAHDVFLLNSLWEGLPISILEAMSIGLPIIASNIKGNNELVSEQNGWLIDPNDTDGIDKVVKTIIEQPEMMSIKGTQSISIVTNHFRNELFIVGYSDLYDKIEE